MKALFLLLLVLSSNSYALNNDCIDFWGNCTEQVKPNQVKPKQKVDYLKLLKASLNWTPNNISPIEKYVSLHPRNKQAVRYLKYYLALRQIRACYLAKGLLNESTAPCKAMEQNWMDWVAGKKQTEKKQAGKVVFLFFYSKDCPYCRKMIPIVKQKLKNAVFIPDIPANLDKYEDWKVKDVPTVIAYFPKRKEAYKVEDANLEKLKALINFVKEKGAKAP